MTQAVAQPVASFADESKWKIVRDVPVFDAHDEYDEKGQLVRSFTTKELKVIADRCNAREKLTGDVSPSGPGHTLRQEKDGPLVKETDQPPILAYGRNYKVGTFGPSEKPALLCDFYIKPEKFQEFLSYPRRSVELWFKDGIIDWIAILRRTPMRDLGLIQNYLGSNVNETDVLPLYLTQKRGQAGAYQRGGLLLYYQMETSMSDEHKPDLAEGRTIDDGGDAIGEHEHDEHDPVVAKCMAAFHKKYGALMEHCSKKYAAEMAAPAAMPSGTNGALPEAVKPGEEVGRMHREGDPLRFEKLERTVADLIKENRTLAARVDDQVGRYQAEARKSQLVNLRDAEGYMLNVDEELTETKGFTDEQFTKHCSRIVAHYQKDPTGGFIPVDNSNQSKKLPETRETPGDLAARTRKLDDCLQYQKEKGCSWEEAVQAVETLKK